MIKRLLVPAVLVGTVLALVVAVDPQHVATSVGRLDLRAVPALLGLGVAFSLLQGLRWHLLLEGVGARLRLFDSVLLNAAGQAITAILPLGDLTRAVFASQATKTEFGKVAATVTVQELAYTLVLVLSATPVLLRLHLGVGAVLAVGGVIAGIVAVLAVPAVFSVVRRGMGRVPGMRRFASDLDALHEQTVALLHRPGTLGWTALDAARAALAVTVLWVVVWALHGGALGWWEAAFVLAISYVGGAVSLIPGGAGASEASMVGLLVLLHVDPASAACAALLQRLVTTGADHGTRLGGLRGGPPPPGAGLPTVGAAAGARAGR